MSSSLSATPNAVNRVACHCAYSFSKKSAQTGPPYSSSSEDMYVLLLAWDLLPLSLIVRDLSQIATSMQFDGKITLNSLFEMNAPHQWKAPGFERLICCARRSNRLVPWGEFPVGVLTRTQIHIVLYDFQEACRIRYVVYVLFKVDHWTYLAASYVDENLKDTNAHCTVLTTDSPPGSVSLRTKLTSKSSPGNTYI